MQTIIIWDFDIETDHLISARLPDLIIIKKKKNENLHNCELCALVEHWIKLKENEKKDKCLDLA